MVERLDDVVLSAIESGNGRLLGSMSHGYRRWLCSGTHQTPSSPRNCFIVTSADFAAGPTD